MMNVLFISAEYPYPPTSGGRLRISNLIDGVRRDASVFLLSFSVEEVSEIQLLNLKPEGVYVELLPTAFGAPRSKLGKVLVTLKAAIVGRTPYVEYFQSEFAKSRIREILETERIDIVQLESAYLGPYVSWLKSHYPNLKVVVDAHNVEADIVSQLVATYTNPLRRWLKRRSANRLQKLELKALQSGDAVLCTSEVDKEKLLRLGIAAKRLYIVPNGVDLQYFEEMTPSNAASPTLVFSGQLSYGPNEYAISWFAGEVWPLLKSKYPKVKWIIVGRNPTDLIASLASSDDSIELHGDVPDIRPYYQQANVAIVPLFHGSGTRLKILESMAMKRVVVSTSTGAEGLNVTNGVDVIVANTKDEFLSAIDLLISKPTLCKRIVESGRKKVEAEYGWGAIGEESLRILKGLVRKT